MKSENQDDELLRSYLLGKLPDEDADRLERRLLADDELFDLAEAMELDLLAAADRGTLTPEEREEVLRKLASSPRGQERLALARSLNAMADETAVDRTVLPFVRRARAVPPAIRWLALAASLIMVTGLGRVAWLHRTEASKNISRIEAQTPVATPAPTPAPYPVRPSVAEKPRPSVPSTAVVMVSLIARRGEAEPVEKLRLSANTQTAEIQIDAGDLDKKKSFSVAIRKGEERVWQESGLGITRLQWAQALVARVPAAILKAGQYEISVTPDEGGSEELTHFEVVRKTM